MDKIAMGRASRWLALAVLASVVAAGCATPQESGPTDLNRDDNRDGLVDQPGTGSQGPGLNNEAGEDTTAQPNLPNGTLTNASGSG